MNRLQANAMKALAGVCVAGTLAAACALIGKEVLTHTAEERAHQVVNGLHLHDQSIDTVAIQLTRQVYSWAASGHADRPSLLWRLRHYLTHDLVPAIFRLPKGAIEMLVLGGECDSAARRLIYVLEAAGIPGEQLNIVPRSVNGHSVVLARFPDGREAMLDPHFGVVPWFDGELLSPSRAFEALNAGLGGHIWRKLAPTSEIWFYARVEHAVFAAQNSPLEIRSEVELAGNEPLALGERDGKFDDVERDGLSHGLTSYWTYLGRKHDRGWTRTLRFAQDTRVEIGLTEPVDVSYITTRTMPRIEGHALVWVVAAGDSLAFVDGLSKRSWSRLKSWQAIDYVHFQPIRRTGSTVPRAMVHTEMRAR